MIVYHGTDEKSARNIAAKGIRIEASTKGFYTRLLRTDKDGLRKNPLINNIDKTRGLSYIQIAYAVARKNNVWLEKKPFMESKQDGVTLFAWKVRLLDGEHGIVWLARADGSDAPADAGGILEKHGNKYVVSVAGVMSELQGKGVYKRLLLELIQALPRGSVVVSDDSISEGARKAWSRVLGREIGLDEEGPLTLRRKNPLARLKAAPRTPVRPAELRKGIRVEKEHTRSKRTAEIIARQHLAEMPDYYTRLLRMEKQGRRNPYTVGRAIPPIINAPQVRVPMMHPLSNPPGEVADLVEVNGTWRSTHNSLGKLIHPTLEGVIAFWKWFGESKVVDKQGRPRVMYHGTQPRDGNGGRGFDVFSPSMHLGGAIFLTPEASYANNFASLLGGSIYPVYVRATNIGKKIYHAADEPIAGKVARSKGMDGFRVSDAPGRDVENIAVFSPVQIKSATGNRGTFDPSDPVITNPRRRRSK